MGLATHGLAKRYGIIRRTAVASAEQGAAADDGHDSFLDFIAHRCPAAAEFERSAATCHPFTLGMLWLTLRVLTALRILTLKLRVAAILVSARSRLWSPQQRPSVGILKSRDRRASSATSPSVSSVQRLSVRSCGR